ncbi:PAS domain-containing protein [Nostoc sp. LEGE 06077]|uniref:PAS domain-containing protein n=1 Tax=Nostoc sp. LEGE 06077 TaxID=915325 RepID=UPI0018801E9C|nr:PAS domain-containing protein [Nostoc sp. LEGE 06077]MBE9210987.1 PAS domain-containing protein [Nostoc sp. LEGE 06077]
MTTQDSALILIADDDNITRIQLRELMEYVGYRVVEASNGCEAIAIYTELHPDIILLDAIMPVMDGFTCCAQLQTLPDIQDTPILMITAAYEPAAVERAFAVGAIDYITKPIQWVVLSHRIRHLLAASRAIKQLRQQSQQAQLQEAQIKIALEAARMGTWDWDIITNQVIWSDNKEILFGLEPGTFDGQYETFLNCIHPQDRDFVNISVMQAVQTDAEYDKEFRIVLADGSIRWLVSKGLVFRNAAGEPVRMSGIVIDITKRKQAEAELRQSEERFQIITRATNDVIWDWDLLTDQVWWNQGVQTLFGYSLAQLNADLSWWYERIHPEDQQRIETDMWDAMNRGQQFWSNEYRFRCYDNSYAYILDRAYIIYDQTGKPVRMIGAMMDITERKRVQAQLQWQNLRSQLFADITLKIRQSLQIDEILQTSVTEVQKLLHADRVLILRLRSNGTVITLKEAVVPGLAVASGWQIHEPAFREMYLLKYTQGTINAISNVDREQANIPLPHLKLLRQLGVQANLSVPIFRQNQIWGLLMAHQCAHPRQWNNWEIELLQQLADQIGIALAQSQILETETRQRQELSRSNEELQQFAFIASHDLQEPLRKIKTFSERLISICGDALPAPASDYLERMQNAVLRMQTLIEDLLTLSRVTTRAQPSVAVNLAQITQEVLSDLEVRIQQTGATIEVGDLPTIKADPLQMRQLMQNLIGNALKFHRPQVPPIVKIYSQYLNNQSEQLVVGLELCQIIVEDNGIGFEQKYSDRIFQIFQRLHGRREYEGTGIGLTICRKIAERHFGRITAQSNPAQGTKFLVTLPINSPTELLFLQRDY